MNFLKDKVPKSFFQFQMKILIFCGLMAPQNRKLLIPFSVYAFLQLFINTVYIIIAEAIQIFEELEDTKNFFLDAGLLSLHILIVFKVYAWFFIKKKVLQIIQFIERPSFNFKVFAIDDIIIMKNRNDFKVDYSDFGRHFIVTNLQKTYWYVEEIRYTKCRY